MFAVDRLRRTSHTDGTLKVLVAMEDSSASEAIVLHLDEAGFRGTPVDSGQAAVEWARENPPHALICDIEIRGMNAIEAAISIRGAWPTCKILLLASNSDALGAVRAAMVRGYFFDLASKAADPETLVRWVMPD